MSHLENATIATGRNANSRAHGAHLPQSNSLPSGLHSGLYTGCVRHRRYAPVSNEFTYSGFWLYLDLAEIDDVFRGRWLWSSRRRALMQFRREDHLLFPDDILKPVPSDQSTQASLGKKPQRPSGQSGARSLPPLDESVRDLVEASTGRRRTGPIRLLTQVRSFGYLMNPVSFYYCFDENGSRVETVVAEVNNTPWGERHCYVLDTAGSKAAQSHTDSKTQDPSLAAVPVRSHSARHLRFEHSKRFHVSPFMQMEMNYRWKLTSPGRTLTVHIENWQHDDHSEQKRRLFDCTFHLQRRPITGVQLSRVLMKHPFMTGKFAGAIYWQALKLWWKRCPFIPHPNSQTQETSKS